MLGPPSVPATGITATRRIGRDLARKASWTCWDIGFSAPHIGLFEIQMALVRPREAAASEQFERKKFFTKNTNGVAPVKEEVLLAQDIMNASSNELPQKPGPKQTVLTSGNGLDNLFRQTSHHQLKLVECLHGLQAP